MTVPELAPVDGDERQVDLANARRSLISYHHALRQEANAVHQAIEDLADIMQAADTPTLPASEIDVLPEESPLERWRSLASEDPDE